MKTENMKLLDLQTGKYLELGKDWLYGGKWIILMSCHRKHYTTIDEYFIESNSINITNTRWLKSEPQGILKTLCDETGAVVYGDRYVLLNFSNNKTVGDVIKHNPKCTQFDQLPKMYHTNKEIYEILTKACVLCEEMGYSSEYVDPNYHCEITGNHFEEYSKQLRKEENKFEELMEKIK